jgi:hypothetical protein
LRKVGGAALYGAAFGVAQNGVMITSASPLPRRKLPIGIQTFREIREDDAY